MKSRLVTVGLTAALLGGLAGGLVLSPGVAIGQSSAPSQSTEKEVERTPGRHLADTLAPLVANGTITQAQADKVIAALHAARPKHGLNRAGGHGKRHLSLTAVAAKLGITEEALRTALESGQSIADIARSKNVSIQSVVDALVAEAKTRLAAKVTAGDLTQAEADARLAKLTERAAAFVNSDQPKFHRRFKKGGKAGSDSTQSSTSTTGFRTA